MSKFHLYDGKNMIHSMKCGSLCIDALSRISIVIVYGNKNFAGKQVDPFGHIVLILSQPILALAP